MILDQDLLDMDRLDMEWKGRVLNLGRHGKIEDISG